MPYLGLLSIAEVRGIGSVCVHLDRFDSSHDGHKGPTFPMDEGKHPRNRH